MSATLIQRLAFRQLPPHLKSVLLALANYAREDGTGARPSLTTLAAFTGRSLVRTKVLVRELRCRGLIVVTRPHAPHRPAEYTLALEAIAALPTDPARQDAQQMPLFPPEFGLHAPDPQGDPRVFGANTRFQQVSTGVHRSPAITTGIVGDPRSVEEIRVQSIRTLRARARKTATR